MSWFESVAYAEDAADGAVFRIVVKEPFTAATDSGHVYVECDPPGGAPRWARGFAPAARNYILQAGATGKVRDDLNYAWTWYIKYDLTNAEYNRIVRRINFSAVTPPDYVLLAKGTDFHNETNCVGWAWYVLQAVHHQAAPPTTVNQLDIHDPNAFAQALAAIGEGGTSTTVRQDPAFPNDSTKTLPLVGTVYKNNNVAMAGAGGGQCVSLNYTEVERWAHEDASLLTSYSAIPSIDYPAGTPIPANTSIPTEVLVQGVDVDRTLVSMDWGDGNNDPLTSQQTLLLTHVYDTPGLYQARLVVMDDSYIRRYFFQYEVAAKAVPESVVVVVDPGPVWPAVENDCVPGRQESVCLADLNGDATVDTMDLLIVIGGWGVCPAQPGFCIGDIAPQTNDFQVGVPDLLKIINSWGPCP